MNHPSQLRKFMKPGTVWTRVNHQRDSQVGGEVIAEKGQPVQVRVHAVTKEGVELEIMDKPGTISYLAWPDPLFMWMTTEPNKITIENKYGPLLTYTRAMSESRSVVEAETPKGIFRAAVGGEPVAYDVKWVDDHGAPHTSRFVSKTPEEAVELLHFGYSYVLRVLSVAPVGREAYHRYHQQVFNRPWDETHGHGLGTEVVEPTQENIDSYEGGHENHVPLSFGMQWPKQPDWHSGHQSSGMSLNRNNRRKSFGYRDAPQSLRDRGWPYANRGFDRRKKAWERAVARFGQVRGEGEGI